MNWLRRMLIAVVLLLGAVASGQAQFSSPYGNGNTRTGNNSGYQTLSGVNQTVALHLTGQPWVGISVFNAGPAGAGGVGNMCLITEFSSDNGVTWDERYMFNGDENVILDCLPHAAEPTRTYTLYTNPADTDVRLRVFSYVANSVTAQVVSSTITDPVVFAYGFRTVSSIQSTINGNGQVVEMPVWGLSGLSFITSAGNNFVGTVVFETNPLSHDSVTFGWQNRIAFGSQTNCWSAAGFPLSSYVGNFGIPLNAADYRVRMRVTAYTSGSMVVRARSTNQNDFVPYTMSAALNGTCPPLFQTAIAGTNGSATTGHTAIAATTTVPTSTMAGMVHRLAPATTYACYIPSQVHVAVANTVHWDLFNADATAVVRVISIKQVPNITTAVTGVSFDWLLERTTSVGTGGTTITSWLADLSSAALNANVTCRSKPTGGAAQSTDLWTYSIISEETNTSTQLMAMQGGLELVPEPMRPVNGGQGIVLRQNQGIRDVQITNDANGNTGWIILFTATT